MMTIWVAMALRAELPPQAKKLEQLVRFEGIDVSRDNRMIVFSGNSNDDGVLFTARRDGSSVKVLLRAKQIAYPTTGSAHFPEFNRKGDRILFLRTDQDDREVCTIPTRGGPFRVVVKRKKGSSITSAFFGPDDSIYFSRHRKGKGHGVTSLWRKMGERRPTRVATFPGLCDFAISPHGRTLAYRRYRSDDAVQLMLRDLRTAHEWRVGSPARLGLGNLVFSLASDRLYFIRAGGLEGPINYIDVKRRRVSALDKSYPAARTLGMDPTGKLLFLEWGVGFREVDPRRHTITPPMEMWLPSR